MLIRLLEKQARLHGEKIAVVDERRRVGFAQLFEEASAAASHLRGQGILPGDPVLIGVPPSVEFFAAFYGCAALGAVILPVLPSGRIPQLMIDRNPAAAIGDPSFLDEARRLCGGGICCVPWSRDDGLREPVPPAPFKRARVWRDQCAVGVSSSGTTGTPALYYRSQSLLVRRGELRAEVLGITPDDVLLATRPFNSGSSVNTHVVTPIVAGCKVVVQERFRRFQAADAIGREKVTVLYAVPYIFELLATIPPAHPVDFSSLRLCIAGGAALADSVAANFAARFGKELRQLYGGSHIHPAFTCNLGDARGAVGKTSGVFPIAILDESGTPLQANAIGEIAFDYDRTARPWKKFLRENPNRRGRYVCTGDLGRTDERGNVFIVGQRSKFIKVRGNRVEPAEVEAVLRAHPAVREAFVYGIDRGRPTEAVAAIVSGESANELELLRHCARRLDGYKCPRKIEVRASLPRNAQGKLARTVLEEEVAAAHER